MTTSPSAISATAGSTCKSPPTGRSTTTRGAAWGSRAASVSASRSPDPTGASPFSIATARLHEPERPLRDRAAPACEPARSRVRQQDLPDDRRAAHGVRNYRSRRRREDERDRVRNRTAARRAALSGGAVLRGTLGGRSGLRASDRVGRGPGREMAAGSPSLPVPIPGRHAAKHALTATAGRACPR